MTIEAENAWFYLEKRNYSKLREVFDVKTHIDRQFWVYKSEDYCVIAVVSLMKKNYNVASVDEAVKEVKRRWKLQPVSSEDFLTEGYNKADRRDKVARMCVEGGDDYLYDYFQGSFEDNIKNIEFLHNNMQDQINILIADYDTYLDEYGRDLQRMI